MKTDNFGAPLAVGDRVVFMGTAGRHSKPELFKGWVTGFTPKGINVGYKVRTYKACPEGTPGAELVNPGYGQPWWRVWSLKEETLNRQSSDIVKVVPNE